MTQQYTIRFAKSATKMKLDSFHARDINGDIVAAEEVAKRIAKSTNVLFVESWEAKLVPSFYRSIFNPDMLFVVKGTEDGA